MCKEFTFSNMKVSDKNPVTSLNTEDLKKSLLEENDFFTKLVDTIPAKMYFELKIQEKITADKHTAMDKVAEAIKRKSNRIELSGKGKHKRARLDPFTQKSVSQIHHEINRKQRKKKKKKDISVSESLTRAANIEELQKRLHEHINELQAKRKAAKNDPKAKDKYKKQVKKLKNKLNKQKGNLAKAKELHETVKTPEKKKSKEDDKPVFNKEGNIIFSKFDFSEDGLEGGNKKSEYMGKKTKKLLKEAEIKKEKLEKLKSEDPEKAKLVEEKEKWKKAILKTEGVKVKDDPKLLKKSLKKEEKKKKKSAKEWKQRVEETEKKKQFRQERRDRNIKKKKKEKQDRKIKLAKKKGRVVLPKA